ncbi:MAG: hypothetical protein R3C12_17265 [Planctomycetaceae bacterium]
MSISRRSFLKAGSMAFAATSLASLPISLLAAPTASDYPTSLAEWSLHKALFGGKVDHLDFAKISKREFGITGVEYVNQFFKDKVKNQDYLREMKTRAADEGVTSLLIMIDGEEAPGDADSAKRSEYVRKIISSGWKPRSFSGAISIRVNAASDGSYDEQVDRAADPPIDGTQPARKSA